MAKFVLVIIGLLLAVSWVFLYSNGIMLNLDALGASWALIFVGILLAIASSLVVIKLYTRKSKLPAIV